MTATIPHTDTTAVTYPPIAALVPHAPPMILLDRIVANGPDFATCALTIKADAPFVDSDGVSTLVCIEYMAQTAAVFAGLAAFADHAPIRWGFLIGCSELQLKRDRIAIGTALTVETRQIWGDSNLGQFKGFVHDATGALIAQATMNVARAADGEMLNS